MSNILNYGASDMQSVRNHRELVRSKTSNFVPNRELEGAIHLVFEGMDNSIDEALNGKGSVIKFIFDTHSKWVTIKDTGRGIPHNDAKGKTEDDKTAFFRACTELYTGAKHKASENGPYEIAGGTNGMGLKLIVYLSKKCIITSERDGLLQQYTFENGIMVDYIEKKSSNRGTTISFVLDTDIIDTNDLTFDILKEDIKMKSYLFPTVEFHLVEVQDDKVIKNKSYKNKDITDAVNAMKPDTPVIRVTSKRKVNVLNKKLNKLEEHTVHVDIAFALKDALIEEKTDENLYIPSFANSIRTTTGGTHTAGLKDGLVKFFKQQLADNKIGILPSDITTALCGYVTVKLSDKEFRGQYKDALNSEAARIAVREAVYEALTKEKDAAIKKMNNFIKDVAKSREASKKSRVKKQQNAFSKDMIEKYSPLLETDNTIFKELYAVEGDSALGSVSQARDINNHAIIPLSRPTNYIDKKYTELAGLKSSFHDFMYVCGIELGKKYNREDINFDKIIFALDGDIDGDGMSAATLALMTKFVPELFEWGLVYRLVPPLYKFRDKKDNIIYLTSQREFNDYIIKDYTKKNVVRFGRHKLSKGDLGKLLGMNLNYASELDILASTITATPKLLERLLWFFDPNLSYDGKDIPFFKEVLKDFPYIDITYNKKTIAIKGEDDGEDVHIFINKFFRKSVLKFKSIQEGNVELFSLTMNDKKVTLYELLKSMEEYMPKDIDRIKGLGELDPVEFRNACMNHKNRKLIKLKFSNHPDKDLERILVHYSKKEQYKATRSRIMRSIIADESIIDT